jgi:hypothetical protein
MERNLINGIPEHPKDCECTKPTCGIKLPVSREYLDLVQKDLYDTIKKAEDSWDPNVSLAGIAILAKYEKLVDVLRDVKEAVLENARH